MGRLTTRVGDKVYYAKGEYSPTTLIAEMGTQEIRECMEKLAEYEDKEDDNKVTISETFISQGSKDSFIFKEGEKYIVNQDEYYVILTDDYGRNHYLTYDDAFKHIKIK